MRGQAEGGWSRGGWFALPALGVAFALLAYWLQRAFWSMQCPGQIGNDHKNRVGDLLGLFAAETILCLAVVAIAAAIGVFLGADRAIQPLSLAIERRGTPLTAVVVSCALLLPLCAAWFVLDRFPNSGDEFGYLFQARTFAGFRLWESAPVLTADLTPYRTWISGSKWVSQYPPGWPLALAAGIMLGLPAWTINAGLGAASVAALVGLCRRVASRSAALVAAALYALTPFYILNAASYFSHIFSSLLVLLLCLCLLKNDAMPQGRRQCAAGAALGALAITRYFDIAALLPALLFWLFAMSPKARPGAIGRMMAGFIPFAGLLAIYQYLITGSPFHSTYFVIHDPDTAVSIEPLRVAVGALLIPVRLAELALWTSPVLLLAYLACLLLKCKDRTLAFYDLIFPGFVIAYVLFADLGGNRYGPRYYMDAFPVLMVTLVSARSSIAARWSEARTRVLAAVASLACLLYLIAAWPLAAAGFHDEAISREEPFRLAAQAGISNAVVVIEITDALGLVSADLVRNPPAMDAPVLYARSDADRNALREAFPTRSLWRYSRLDPNQPGDLVRIAP